MPSGVKSGSKSAAERSERARARPREILDAARALFAQKGFEATRMDEVAAAVGVTKPAVYRYFPGKERLIEALLEQDLAAPSRLLYGWVAAHPGPISEMIEGFSQRMAANQKNGLQRSYVLLAMNESGRHPELAEFIRREVLGPGLGALADCFQRAMDRGELSPGHDPEFVARVFFAPFLQATLGTIGYALPVGDDAEIERYRQFHVAAFMRAFAI